ncbi:BspA family leucine-rich repeat surface protein [Candidatus Venteria ishoeyi]|nr:BspA family leucine-rich repeat surface protein [Candidatus Venteria ishoeyi]
MPKESVTPTDEPFIISVKTDNTGTSNNDQFTIPTNSGAYTYDYSVSYNGQTLSNQTGNVTLTFPSGAGTYDVEINGTFPQIYFNNGGDKDKLLEIKQWGDIVWSSFNSAFNGCTNFTTISTTDIPNTSNVELMNSVFKGAGVTSISFVGWDLTSLTTLNASFRNAVSLTTINFTGVSTPNLTNLSQTFYGQATLNLIGINELDTSSLINIGQCFTWNQWDGLLDKWDVSSLTSASNFRQILGGFSTTNYDALLIGWEQSLQDAFPNGVGYTPTISIAFGSSKYTSGGSAETARTSLINNFGWTITDGGSV